ncbi:hypothetical protein TURU_047156 [Turdus rufiventris]|nr:hypothetical protein TURU_047156 [Turdus rufiventris]
MEESPNKTMKFPREREHLPYGARLESWGCSSWRGEGCGESSQHPPGSGGTTEEEEELWTRSWSGRIMENGLKLTERKFRWDIGKEFLPVRVVRPWHRLPRAAVTVLQSLAVSKARLDEAWSSLE